MNYDIVVFCGVPGSGKDYIARTRGYNIVSLDKCRLEVFREAMDDDGVIVSPSEEYDLAFNYCCDKKINLGPLMEKKIKAWMDSKASMDERFSKMELNGYFEQKRKDLIAEPMKIAICNTHMNPKSRKRTLEMLRKLGVKKVGCCFVDVEREVAIERDSVRLDHRVGEKVIDQMFSSLVYPTTAEGFDSIEIIDNNSNGTPDQE